MESRFKTNTSLLEWSSTKAMMPLWYFIKGSDRLKKESNYCISKIEDFFNENMSDPTQFKKDEIYYLQDSEQCFDELPFIFNEQTKKLAMVRNANVMSYIEIIILSGYMMVQKPKGMM